MSILCPFGRIIPKLDVKNVTAEQKRWFAQEIIQDPSKLRFFVAKTGLNVKTLWHWKNQVAQGNILHENGGRPKLIDDEEMKAVVQDIERGLDESNGLDSHQRNERFKIAAENTHKKRGLHFSGEISERTRQRYMRNYNISMKNAEIKTAARFQAEHDVKNAFSHIIVLSAVLPMVKGIVL